MALSSTHTFAEMQISGKAYDEIRAKLEDAGYGHALLPMEGGVTLDMHGIGLTRAPEPVGFVKSECKLSDADVAEIRRSIAEGLIGPQNCGRPVILESGARVIFEAAAPKSLEMVEVWPC